MGFNSLMSNVSRRPPTVAQATCVAAGSGALALVWAACEGTHTVSPSARVMKALPLLLRATRLSTHARKP